MPSLKIGCRVIHKNNGHAVLAAYDNQRNKPWRLETPLESFWASHDEFRNADHGPAVPVRAAQHRPKSWFGWQDKTGGVNPGFSIFTALLRLAPSKAALSPGEAAWGGADRARHRQSP